jgi:type I restriction enzyme S subunit
VLRIPNIVSGKIDPSDMKFARDASDLSDSDALFPGDMLIVRTNGSRDLIGRSAVIQQSFDRPHFYASYLIRFRLLAADGVPRWIGAIWDSRSIRAQIEHLAATTAGQ